jgi:cysteinyl-tRNA synthetase
MEYLGDAFDIHGGGRDLIFPHHENEIAQSEGASSKPFARFWVHHGLITVGGQKMSKSMKNFITLDAVLKEDPRYGDEILKLTFLGTHYSAPLDYSPERSSMDRSAWKRFFEFFQNSRILDKEGHRPAEKKIPQIYALFRDAMDNDFNTPDVLAVMHKLISDAYKEKDPIFTVTVASAIRNFGAEVFGIVFDQEDISGLTKDEIERCIAERADAKKKKDYKTSDALRERLLKEKKVELRDLPDGRTTWRVRL